MIARSQNAETQRPKPRFAKLNWKACLANLRSPSRLCVLVLGIGTALAAEPVPAKKITYEDDVLPIFRDNCLKCHNPDKLKGDLDLTSFGTAMKGGGSGVDLNSGDPDGSQLYRSIM